jgi:salicylate hydroxylase
LTVHRADLHRLLLDAASADGIAVQCGQAFRFDRQDWQSDATGLIACDGLWSSVRQALWPDGPPSATGHIAYRALVSPRALSSALSSDFPCDQVTVWLGAAMHAVAYPVRGGALVNLVVIVEGNGDHATSQAQSWSQTSSAQALQRHLHPAGQGPHPQPRYRAFWQAVQAVPDWTQWQLHARVPLTRPAAMAQGRVALLGDAAHPMRPYLAQGAAMALEDAAQLGQSLLAQSLDVPSAWQHYAQRRWARNARVQRQSQRNGVIFHATGPLRLARDAAMRWAGPRVMDSPWLYRG